MTVLVVVNSAIYLHMWFCHITHMRYCTKNLVVFFWSANSKISILLPVRKTKQICYLRKLFFSGSRLCLRMLLSFLLSGGTQQKTSFQDTIWLSGCPCWTGGCSGPFWIIQGRKQTRLILFWGLL